jgi:hypothetical protein
MNENHFLNGISLQVNGMLDRQFNSSRFSTFRGRHIVFDRKLPYHNYLRSWLDIRKYNDVCLMALSPIEFQMRPSRISSWILKSIDKGIWQRTEVEFLRSIFTLPARLFYHCYQTQILNGPLENINWILSEISRGNYVVPTRPGDLGRISCKGPLMTEISINWPNLKLYNDLIPFKRVLPLPIFERKGAMAFGGNDTLINRIDSGIWAMFRFECPHIFMIAIVFISFHFMIWYGMVWHGMKWNEMKWNGGCLITFVLAVQPFVSVHFRSPLSPFYHSKQPTAWPDIWCSICLQLHAEFGEYLRHLNYSFTTDLATNAGWQNNFMRSWQRDVLLLLSHFWLDFAWAMRLSDEFICRSFLSLSTKSFEMISLSHLSDVFPACSCDSATLRTFNSRIRVRRMAQHFKMTDDVSEAARCRDFMLRWFVFQSKCIARTHRICLELSKSEIESVGMTFETWSRDLLEHFSFHLKLSFHSWLKSITKCILSVRGDGASRNDWVVK